MSSVDSLLPDDLNWTDQSDWSVLLNGSDGSEPSDRSRAELAEAKLTLVVAERDRLREDIEYLRDQLEVRSREIERHATAEQQLRVMLLRLEETNRQLAGALVLKALPPTAPHTQPGTPEKVRWWVPWRRG